MGEQPHYTRWDAVVPASPQSAAERFPSAGADGSATAGQVSIRVWLYGGLAPTATERPVCLSLAAPLTIRDVILALQQRLDDWPADLIFNGPGELSRRCRLFVDGVSCHELDMPVGSSAHSTQIEMILLTANEGG